LPLENSIMRKIENQLLIDEIDQYLKRLFPITRSITGSGNRETLHILQEIVPLEIRENKSGTPVYDWIIPDEWQVSDAWIKDRKGNKLVDFQVNNVHLVSYSKPVDKKLSFEELSSHLYYNAEMPEAIPYRTSYYKRDWGFCVTKSQYDTLEETEGLLEIYIDSQFNSEGSLTIGELLIPGKSKKEILISTYICHPSLANDNLSGIIMTVFLARELMKQDRQWSYRLVWLPETIGAITYCAMNETEMKLIEMGLVITTVGGPGQFSYKQSWQSNHPINQLIEETFNEAGKKYIKYPFDIHGSDERQYSSPGFRINVATIAKDRYYEYPEYHTSKDDLDFVSSQHIVETLDLYKCLISKLEQRVVYKNLFPDCEVMLSRHGLYSFQGGMQNPVFGSQTELDLILWLLFYCDGKKSLNEIAELIGVSIRDVENICTKLEIKGIVARV
jgi:aminopeptidase-like protein